MISASLLNLKNKFDKKEGEKILLFLLEFPVSVLGMKASFHPDRSVRQRSSNAALTLDVFWLEGFLARVAEVCCDTGGVRAVAPFSVINHLELELAEC